MTNIWIVLFVIWVCISYPVTGEIAVIGAIISAALAYVFLRNSDIWRSLRWSPRALYHFAAYIGIFIVELVRANLNVMRYVYSPRIDIHPGVVRIRTRLKSPLGRLALANTIALTPGSLILDIDGDTMFVHWLDVKTTDIDEATRMLAGPFEKHLEAIFG